MVPDNKVQALSYTHTSTACITDSREYILYIKTFLQRSSHFSGELFLKLCCVIYPPNLFGSESHCSLITHLKFNHI